MEVKVRDLDAQLEENRAFPAGHFEECLFSCAMHGDETRLFGHGQIADILNMASGHNHGVSGDSGVRVKKDARHIILIDDFAQCAGIGA